MTPSTSSLPLSLKITLLVLNVAALILALVCIFNIYSNNKTDQLNFGEITVTSCREEDRAWKIHSCTGDYFSTGGGMTHRNDVTVTVFGRMPKTGEVVTDVYPPEYKTNQTTDHFVTGRERASVTYNVLWLIGVFIGLLIPIITLLYLYLYNKRTNKTK